jgi:hypothetical protein
MARKRNKDPDEVLVTMTPKPVRRVVAAGTTGLLAQVVHVLVARVPDLAHRLVGVRIVSSRPERTSSSSPAPRRYLSS